MLWNALTLRLKRLTENQHSNFTTFQPYNNKSTFQLYNISTLQQYKVSLQKGVTSIKKTSSESYNRCRARFQI